MFGSRQKANETRIGIFLEQMFLYPIRTIKGQKYFISEIFDTVKNCKSTEHSEASYLYNWCFTLEEFESSLHFLALDFKQMYSGSYPLLIEFKNTFPGRANKYILYSSNTDKMTKIVSRDDIILRNL